jgi:TolB-like protein
LGRSGLADVFISYARTDRARIETLAAALETAGYSLWWDRHIEGGAEFSKDIERELGAAKAVVVAWSKSAETSRWVKDEATIAANSGKLVALTLDGTAAPIGFRQFQVISYATGDAADFAELRRSVEAKLAGAPAPSPAPAAPPRRFAPMPAPLFYAALAAIAALVVGAALIIARPFRPPPSAAPQGAATTVTPHADEAAAQGAEAAAKDARVGLGVLPFTNLSSDPEQEHFADGLTEEVLNWLGNVEGLRVPGRTSSFQFKGKAEDLRAIAATLGVDYLLEGSVRRSGDALRITAQLIEAKAGSHLWSKTYDRKLADIFAIQDEIARIVVTELLGKIPETGAANPAAVGDVDPKAHELYLEGRALLTLRQWENAYIKLRDAVAVDPRHALAQAYLAVIASHAHANAYPLPGDPDRAAVATKALAQAVRLKPEAADVLFAQGWVVEAATHFSAPAPAAATDLYERAVRINPRHIEALHALARGSGEEKAIETYERVLAIDPAHQAALTNLTANYLERGERAKAAELARRALKLAPDSRFAPAITAKWLGDMELLGEALFADWDAIERDITGRWMRAETLANLGAVDEAAFLFARETARQDSSWPQLMHVYAAVLRRDAKAELAAARELHGLEPAPDFSAWRLAQALLNSGEPGPAYDVLVAGRPDIASGKPPWAEFSDFELLAAAQALHLAGRRDDARAVWGAALAAVKSEPAPTIWVRHLELSLLHASLGDRPAAIREFRAAYDAGFRYLWSPYGCSPCVYDGFSSGTGLFSAVAAIPENAALIEKVKAENAATLEAFNRRYGVLDKARALMAAEGGGE